MATKRELAERGAELEEGNQELQDRLDAVYDIVAPDEDEEDLDEMDEEGQEERLS